jgi:hypothetical protein
MTRRHSRSEYERLLARREREGWTYEELAQRTGLNARTLAWWGWRLRRDSPTRPSPVFAEVVTAVEEPQAGVAIQCRDGMRLLVERGFDGETLRRVLDLVRERC